MITPPRQFKFVGRWTRSRWPNSAWTAALLLAAGGSYVLMVAPLGPLSRHMAAHVLLMNAVAPSVAFACMSRPCAFARKPAVAGSLSVACAAQIAALWIIHAPPVLVASLATPAAHILIQTSLLGIAVWFWFAVLAQQGAARWRALFALLVTGKLFCLFAALLVFAPRALYSGALALHTHAATTTDPLSDQQFAGLLMLVVCPLTYVAGGVVIAERWLRELRDVGLEAHSGPEMTR